MSILNCSHSEFKDTTHAFKFDLAFSLHTLFRSSYSCLGTMHSEQSPNFVLNFYACFTNFLWESGIVFRGVVCFLVLSSSVEASKYSRNVLLIRHV